MDKEVLKLKNRINFIEQSLQKLIYTSNQLEWTYQNNNINLITSSIVPISKINICFNKKLKSKEFFLNDLNVMVFKHNKFNNLNCYSKEITLVSDRVLRKMNLSKPTHFIASEDYEIINTSFNVVPSDNTKPDYIYYKTINSNDYVLSKYSNKHIKKYYRSNIHNNPIISEKDYFKKYLIFEGKNFVNHDLILDNPVLGKPGTNFILDENVSIIFKDKVLMLGKKIIKSLLQEKISKLSGELFL